MMSLTFGLFTQVSGSGPLGPLVCTIFFSSPEPKAQGGAYGIGRLRPSVHNFKRLLL